MGSFYRSFRLSSFDRVVSSRYLHRAFRLSLHGLFRSMCESFLNWVLSIGLFGRIVSSDAFNSGISIAWVDRFVPSVLSDRCVCVYLSRPVYKGSFQQVLSTRAFSFRLFRPVLLVGVHARRSRPGMQGLLHSVLSIMLF